MKVIKPTGPHIPQEIYDEKGNCYKVEKEIGKGGFGNVYTVRDSTKKKFACKVSYIFKNIPQDSSESKIREERDKLKSEAKLLKSLDHPNVIDIECSFHDDNYVYMVMELCRGSLHDYLKENGLLSEERAIFYIIQLFSSIEYCHQKNIIHRDIKLQNILLTNRNKTLKLADFGLSKQVLTKEERLKTDCGATRYIAPEVMNSREEKGYSFKADIWSTCVVFYRLIYGIYPFDDHDIKHVEKRIKSGVFNFPPHKEVSKEFKHCIMRIFDVNPRLRPTVMQILDFPLFKKYLSKNNLQSTIELSLRSLNIVDRYELPYIINRKRKSIQKPLTKKRKLSEIINVSKESINRFEVVSSEAHCSSIDSFAISSPHFKHDIFSLIHTAYSYLDKTIRIRKKVLDIEALKCTKPTTPIFVTKVFTIGPNYGVGYELTNDTQAMLFKDGSTLYSNSSAIYHYSYYSNLKSLEICNYSESLKLVCSKNICFNSCRNIMSNYSDRSIFQAPYSENNEKVYVVGFVKAVTATVLFFTSGNIQFNFDDNRKLILSQDARTLSLIQPNGNCMDFNTIEVISSFFKLDSDNNEYAEFRKFDCYHYILCARKILNDIVKESYFED
jgi:serine/threonine protein kinase